MAELIISEGVVGQLTDQENKEGIWTDLERVKAKASRRGRYIGIYQVRTLGEYGQQVFERYKAHDGSRRVDFVDKIAGNPVAVEASKASRSRIR